MPVFVFSNAGLIEQRPDGDWKQVGHEIAEYNRQNPSTPRKLLVGPTFPPAGQVFDSESGKFRAKSYQERIDAGELVLPAGFRIETGLKGEAIVSATQKLNAAGDVVEKSAQQLIADGLLAIDPATQKVENDRIVPKSQQELLSAGILSYELLRDAEIGRLRTDVEKYFLTNRTTNGYRLDNLARQKAALTMQYRTLPETDSTKADLLSRQLIYPDAVCDEILGRVEIVQAAYTRARAAIEDCVSQQKSVAEFEAVKIETFIT